MKKLLPIIFAIAMLTVCLVSIDTDSSDADIDTGFWVNNHQITREADDSGTGWKYVKDTNTLILTDGTFSTNHTDQYDGGLFLNAHQRCSPIYYTYEDKLTIELHGNNVIKDYGPGQAGAIPSANGILVFGDLEITGDGALDIKGGGTNGMIIDGALTISSGIITISGSHDEMNLWVTQDARAASFTMTDGRLRLLENENPGGDQLLFYCDGNFNMSGGSIDTAGVIRGYDYAFTLSGGIIKDASMTAGEMLIEFGTLNYGGSALNNLHVEDSARADNKKLVCTENGAASVGTEPAQKYIILNGNEGTHNSCYLMTGDDGKLTSLPDPTREGYNFEGWYTAADGGDRIDLDKVYTEDMTIYAHWSKTGGLDENLTAIIIGVVTGALVIGVVAIVLIRKH